MNTVARALGMLLSVVLVLVALALLVGIVQAAAAIVHGDRHVEVGATVMEFFFLACVVWYVNLVALYSQMRAHNPTDYEEATKGMGFMAFFWSSRSSALLLYQALGELELDQYPQTFQRRVRVMRVASRVLLAAILLSLLGIGGPTCPPLTSIWRVASELPNNLSYDGLVKWCPDELAQCSSRTAVFPRRNS